MDNYSNISLSDFFNLSISPLDPDYDDIKYQRNLKILDLLVQDLYLYLTHRKPKANLIAYVTVLTIWNHVNAYEVENDMVVTLPPYPFDPKLIDPTTHPPFPFYYYEMVERYEGCLADLVEILDHLGMHFKAAGC